MDQSKLRCNYLCKSYKIIHFVYVLTVWNLVLQVYNLWFMVLYLSNYFMLSKITDINSEICFRILYDNETNLTKIFQSIY